MALNIASSKGPIPVSDTHEAPSRSISGSLNDFFSNFIKPIKTWELLFFASQLSLMLEIGTSLNIALKAIADQSENPALRDLLQDVLQDVEEGRQLSAALRRHPRVFNNMFISMVKAGETGGFLQDILNKLVDLQERNQVLRAQVKSAMTYPAILCVAAVLVVIFILVFVLPRFAPLFAGKEMILPFTTKFLMALSVSLKEYWCLCANIGETLTP